MRPHINGDGRALVAVGFGARSIGPAFGLLVDVCLDDASPDHSRRASVEAPRNLLDGREVDLHLSQPGPEEKVTDENQDDECEGVEVGEDVVGEAVESHDSGLGGEVVVQLVVSEPVNGVPQED